MTMNPANLNGAHLEQYFGFWAMHEETFRSAAERITRMDLQLHLAEAPTRSDKTAVQAVQQRTDDGILILELRGVLMKFVGSLMEGTSTVFARRMLRAAVADDDVHAIMLRIDSPGGTVSGTELLAAEVMAAARVKPVYAYLEDLGASAAYWIASQTSRIAANPTALIGSIGTFGVVWDMSGAAAQAGIKVHVIRAGAFKGAGEPGTEVTPGQLAEWQRLVNQLNDHFVAGVSQGRKLPPATVRGLADGRLHLAKDAQELGLIDVVQSFDAAMVELRAAMETFSYRKEALMGGNTEPQPATIAELKSKFPEGDADFRESCLERGLTLAQAEGSWKDYQLTRLGAEQKALTAKFAQAEAAHAEQVKSWEEKITTAEQERDDLKQALAESGSPEALGAKPDAAGDTSRAGVIKQARTAYAAMDRQSRAITSEQAFVNDALRTSGDGQEDPLTADETRALRIRTAPQE